MYGVQTPGPCLLQVVMEGMVQIRLKPWLRRAITRCAAIVPAAIVAGVGGNAAAGKLLVLSQVCCAIQAPDAMLAFQRE